MRLFHANSAGIPGCVGTDGLGASWRMTLLWLAIWFLANLIGGNEPLKLDPVNAWTATLILAIAIDLNRPRLELGRGKD
jgi:hypothetical protein